ncbi:MAG: hypothetical protein IJD96_06640 [Lachnospiraceae bacterium]|nr:hypothetical protein [Lachnospiraceae bacterium]
MHRSSRELSRVAIRLVKEPPLYSNEPVNTPQDAIRVLADVFSDYDREVVIVVNLRPDLKPICMNIASIGALDYSMSHPRELLKSMVLSNAAKVLLVHNHTTGRVLPSEDDISMTDRMAKVCDLVGIPLIDHIIIGPGEDYYSFAEKKILPLIKSEYSKNIEDIKLGGMNVAEKTNVKEKKQVKISFTVSECGEFPGKGEYHENIGTLKEAIEKFEKIPSERMNGIPAIGIRASDVKNKELFTEVNVFTGKQIDVEALKYVPEIKEHKAAQFAIAELLYKYPEAEVIGEVPEEIQKKVMAVEINEKQTAQLKEITDKLEQGVKEVFSSEKYQQYLDMIAKFPRYSANNSLLIMMQKPDAQMCQSFTGWKEMGRFVKKGEKGIKIIAPAPYTIQREQQKVDETGKPVFDKDGEAVMETVDVKVNAFKVVNTFDVSQTYGEELPSYGVEELTGEVDRFSVMFDALKEICPVPMRFENIESGAKGYYSQTEKRIAIQEGMSEVQTIKTAIHEMAHQKLHAVENAKDAKQTRSSKEVEAESVAYTICQHYGIDTSDYSFSYVAGWSEGKDVPELKESLDTIRKAASEMIKAIDDKMEELLKGKEQEKENDTPLRDEEPAKKKEALQTEAKEKTPEKEKRGRKPSVKSKLQEGKEKSEAAKPAGKKTKQKEAGERV